MTNAENEKIWNTYFYNNTDVLINNFNIKDSQKLKEIEATISFERLLELDKKPLELGLDKEHLKAVHKYIFSEVYPFAGNYRKANLSKRVGSFLQIEDDNSIDTYLGYLFSEANTKLAKCSSMLDFSETLAFLYTGLIHCHPFMEGNGRAIREFIREFSILKSKEMGMTPVELDWRLIDKTQLNQHLAVDYMIYGNVTILFRMALVPKDEAKKYSSKTT